MSKLATVLLFVLVLPGLAIIVAVVVRLALKGTRPSSRETPSARIEEQERQEQDRQSP